MDVNKLLKKSLACFCCFCLDSNFQSREKLPWTNEWEVEVLILDSVAYVHSAMEVTFQVDEWDEYMDMMVITWLPTCHWETILEWMQKKEMKVMTFTSCYAHKIVFTVDSSFKCPWGQGLCVGDIVIASKYYQNWGRSKCSYVLLIRSQVAYIHAMLGQSNSQSF
jgi:spore maturation protein CgeB